MAPAAHTSQTPASGDVDNGAAITLGVRLYAPDGATVSGIAFYAPATNSGTYSARLWLSTAPDDSAAGTLLQSGSLASGSVTPGAWNTIPLAAPVELTADTVYTAGVHTSSGRFVLTSGAFSAAISGNGIVLIQSGDDPVGFGVSRNGVFTEGASPTFPTSTFGLSDYFIDVELASNESTAELDVTLPALTVTATAEASTAAAAAVALPALTSSFTGAASAPAALTVTLPALTAEFTAQVPISGTLDATLPALTVSFAVASAGAEPRNPFAVKRFPGVRANDTLRSTPTFRNRRRRRR